MVTYFPCLPYLPRWWHCGFVDFTKLSFACSSLAQPFDQMWSVPEYIFVLLSQRKAYAEHFQKETDRKRSGPITKWPPRRLLFTRLEVIFLTISPFTKQKKVVPKGFQESECCLEGLIDLACGLQLQMLPRLNGHFSYECSRMVLHLTQRLLLQLLASMLSSHVRFQVLDSSYQFNCIIEGKATEKLAS